MQELPARPLIGRYATNTRWHRDPSFEFFLLLLSDVFEKRGSIGRTKYANKFGPQMRRVPEHLVGQSLHGPFGLIAGNSRKHLSNQPSAYCRMRVPLRKDFIFA